MKLEYFRELITLVRMENYLSAAEALHLSQSTLSRHVMLTEEYFGIRIFNREVKHFSVTREGEYLLRYAAEIVELYDNYRNNLQSPGEPGGAEGAPGGQNSTI
ncbi:MAG: LysR family transcriptional regulator [Clostridium lundense]|nr:LysR family transcriptional regulator [Clostridium lundense]